MGEVVLVSPQTLFKFSDSPSADRLIRANCGSSLCANVGIQSLWLNGVKLRRGRRLFIKKVHAGNRDTEEDTAGGGCREMEERQEEECTRGGRQDTDCEL